MKTIEELAIEEQINKNLPIPISKILELPKHNEMRIQMEEFLEKIRSGELVAS
jgi:hypothetical protein